MFSTIQVIDHNGNMTADVGPYAGLDRFEARRRVVADRERIGGLTPARIMSICRHGIHIAKLACDTATPECGENRASNTIVSE